MIRFSATTASNCAERPRRPAVHEVLHHPVWVIAIVAMLLPVLTLSAPVAAVAQQSASWPGFRGPGADGAIVASSLSDADALSLEVAWKRPIGSGYSGVSVSADLVVTMFVDGDQDTLAAFDPDTGAELWRFPFGPTYKGHDGSFDGPMSTPLLVGDMVIGLSGWGRLFAVDRLGGEPVWSTQLTEDHGAVKPEYGFATSPLLQDGVLVVQIGAPDGALAGFDPETGDLLWKAGEDAIAYQSPVSMSIGGREQVVAAGLTELLGVDPSSGEVLWEVTHGGDGYLGAQSLVPVSVGDDRIFLAFKDQSSTVVAIDPAAARPAAAGPAAGPTSLWEDRTIRNTYSVAVHRDGYVYGFSSRFLTAVDAATGEAAWKSRPPGDGFPILVDDHLVILTKDGSLHIVEATPEEYREKASIQVFDDLAWVHPSFSMGSVFVRSTGEIARVDIRRGARRTEGVAYEAGLPPAGSEFAAFLARVDVASDKAGVIDDYLAGKEFPLTEGDSLAHFVYRGPGADLAVAGDMIGSRQEARMHHVEGTDLFYFSAALAPEMRLNYRFIRDYEDILDPRNPRETISYVHAADMAIAGPDDSSAMSWMAMPAWQPPAHLREPAAGVPRGRFVERPVDIGNLEGPASVKVYLPPGYDDGDQRYPVAYVHGGMLAGPEGRIDVSLDNLIDQGMAPMIAVFVHVAPDADSPVPVEYSRVFADEVVPFVDAEFRTLATAEGRASVGSGWFSYPAVYVAFDNPGLIGSVAAQSMFMLDNMRVPLEALITTAAELPLDVYVDWGALDLQNPQEAWDTRVYSSNFAEFLRSRGYTVAGGEAPDSTGWDSWRNRNDVVLQGLFSR